MNSSHFLRPIGALNFLAAVLALAQMGPAVTRAAAYDLSSDYSATSNPNGVWSYGATTNLGGTFVPFTVHTPALAQNGVSVDVWLFGFYGPEIWHNGTASTAIGDGGQGVYPPGTVELVSGGNGIPYGFGVARFTAPQSGSYLVQTAVKNYLDGSLSADSDFHVLDNGAQLFLAQILPSPSAPGPAYSYTTTLNLAAGDTIDFVCGRGLDGNGDFSAITIQASLSLVPEPASFSLIGLASLALVMVKRRK